MNVQPTDLEFKVDTCADVTAVRQSLYYSLKPTHVLNKASRLLMGSCKQKQKILKYAVTAEVFPAIGQ